MKMEKTNDYTSKNADSSFVPLATDIGREFVRQYYTKWSFQLNEVFQFYGNESIFLHDDKEAKGQEAIQKVIEKLNYEDCKARIHSVIGVYSVNESLVLQVCGELSINQGLPRRFLQHFVLCKQQAKKYYVQNDIFQWLDKSFCDTIYRNDMKSAHNNVNEAKKEELSVEQVLQQNGHSLQQQTLLQHQSPLNDLNSLSKIVKVTDNISVKDLISSVDQQSSLTNNNSNNFLSSTKPVVSDYSTKTLSQQSSDQHLVLSSTQPVQQHQAESLQTNDILSDNLTTQSQSNQHHQSPTHQQSPPKQFPQQRSFGTRQRSSYNQNHQHGNASQQSYRHQSQMSLPHQQSQPQQQHQPIQQQQQIKRQDSHPKTWAKAVSNNPPSIGLSQQNSNNFSGIGSAGLGNPSNNNNGNSYSNQYHHSNNHHSQPHQQYRSQFTGGNGGVGANNQRKQYPVKMHK